MIRGQPAWILLAACLQVLYYAVFAAIFKSAFHTVDIESRIRDLIPVALGALFINTVAPTWGMAGAALFVDNVSYRGQQTARAAAGTLLAQTADFSAFALILAGGIAYLSLKNKLQSYEIAGTAFLILLLSSLSLFLVLGLWHPVLPDENSGLNTERSESAGKISSEESHLVRGLGDQKFQQTFPMLPKPLKLIRIGWWQSWQLPWLPMLVGFVLLRRLKKLPIRGS